MENEPIENLAAEIVATYYSEYANKIQRMRLYYKIYKDQSTQNLKEYCRDLMAPVCDFNMNYVRSSNMMRFFGYVYDNCISNDNLTIKLREKVPVNEEYETIFTKSSKGINNV